MLINRWLMNATKKLENNNITTARLDCLVLLEDATGIDRGYLIAHPELPLNAQHLAILNKLVTRRAEHEPLAYIRGKTEFYGREFIVNRHVLEPRPESETMVDLFKNLKSSSRDASVTPWTVVDVGTGSGALGITAALEVPTVQVTLTEIDPTCLKAAANNAKRYGIKARLLQGDLLAPLPNSIFQIQSSILLANLPYIPDDYPINEAAAHEPKLAIFGGTDGLDLYRRLFSQIKELRHKPLYVLTESLPVQHPALTRLAKLAGYNFQKDEDFIQVFQRA